jgi:hypothetical protein
MFKRFFVIILLMASSTFLHAKDFRIEAGKDYHDYSNEELRRRVWTLERAVSQLQDQVFQLALRNGGSALGDSNANSTTWTCRIESFGKTFVSSGKTKSIALALVLKKCADASNAIHCHEEDVKCGDE